jgi:hypothetical protein
MAATHAVGAAHRATAFSIFSLHGMGSSSRTHLSICCTHGAARRRSTQPQMPLPHAACLAPKHRRAAQHKPCPEPKSPRAQRAGTHVCHKLAVWDQQVKVLFSFGHGEHEADVAAGIGVEYVGVVCQAHCELHVGQAPPAGEESGERIWQLWRAKELLSNHVPCGTCE